MTRHILQLVTNGKQNLNQVIEILESCSSHMIDILQIREKKRSARELLLWYEACMSALPQTSIIINDRVDVAAAVQASGVQLAYHSLPPEAARLVLPNHIKVGCSVHSVEEAQHAYRAGAHFVVYGHVYSSLSKPDIVPRGVKALKDVVESVEIPVIAIGGIQTQYVDEVLSTGCSGIAVMSSVLEHNNPNEQVKQFRKLLDQSSYLPRHPFPKF